MNYADLYKNAVAAKTVRELAPVFVKFEEEGQLVIGKLLSKTTVKSRQSGGSYNDYVVDTDEGTVHFACGNQFDERIGNTLGIGRVYAWTYKGKRDIGKGRRVNEFSCVHVPVEGELFDVPAPEENPL